MAKYSLVQPSTRSLQGSPDIRGPAGPLISVNMMYDI